ncbi:hypothetical protein DDR33_07140 [Pararcticibacter amylolyticus]|uniref:Uncharacterized protein n=1 Tax=Pararcticibacter amylolyticus TaxID=2173175 RepID=A0A2U2PKB1_9SPHI|nr:hypothetical protein DDR33_07140 [Pararcticibacter amylolyticus]
MKIAVITDKNKGAMGLLGYRPPCLRLHNTNLYDFNQLHEQTNVYFAPSLNWTTPESATTFINEIDTFLSEPYNKDSGFVLIKLTNADLSLINFSPLQVKFKGKGFIYWLDSKFTASVKAEEGAEIQKNKTKDVYLDLAVLKQLLKSYNAKSLDTEIPNFTHDVNYIGTYRAGELFTFIDMSNLRFRVDYAHYTSRAKVNDIYRDYLQKNVYIKPSLALDYYPAILATLPHLYCNEFTKRWILKSNQKPKKICPRCQNKDYRPAFPILKSNQKLKKICPRFLDMDYRSVFPI